MTGYVPRAQAVALLAETLELYLGRLGEIAPELARLLAEGDRDEAGARMERIERELLAEFRRRLAEVEVAGSA